MINICARCRDEFNFCCNGHKPDFNLCNRCAHIIVYDKERQLSIKEKA